MRTIAFLHQKGGTGKTTQAIATAMAMAEQGARVLLLDADVQGTASEWASHWGERFRVVARSQIQPIVHDQVARFASRFEWMVVDGPPTLSDMTTSILRGADRVFVPVRPSYPDIWALEGVAALRATLGGEGINPACGCYGIKSWSGRRRLCGLPWKAKDLRFLRRSSGGKRSG
jgi:chromosome partitioning protein